MNPQTHSPLSEIFSDFKLHFKEWCLEIKIVLFKHSKKGIKNVLGVYPPPPHFIWYYPHTVSFPLFIMPSMCSLTRLCGIIMLPSNKSTWRNSFSTCGERNEQKGGSHERRSSVFFVVLELHILWIIDGKYNLSVNCKKYWAHC